MKRRSCLKSLKSRRHTVGLRCPTGSNCRHAWRCAVDQIFFFTSQKDVGSIFSWGAKSKSNKTKPEDEDEEEELSVEDQIGTFTKDQFRKESLQTFDRLRRKSQIRNPSQDLIDANNASLDKFETLEGGKCIDHRCPEKSLPPLDEQINRNDNGSRIEPAGKLKMKYSGQNRGQAALQSRRIVISTEDLAGRDVARVVWQRMNALEKKTAKHGTVVRSTALIVKSSRGSSSPSAAESGRTYVLLTPGEYSTITTVIDGSPGIKPKDTMGKQPNGKVAWKSNQFVADTNSLGIAKSCRVSRVEPNRRSWEWTGSQTDCCVARDSFDHARSSSDSNLRPPSMITTKVTEKIESKQARQEGKQWHKAFHLFLPAFILVLAVLFSLFQPELTILNQLRIKRDMVNELIEETINNIRNQYCIPMLEAFRNRLAL
ncbi:uncharacterized protein LOC108629725 isoform X2 [Ceratina calcarata]|uniref:Uncharacterized protein LOC108629725 isoform X2 n=1 Tax=Ceratina calcarata TaxID=156304 RepID=A0AAJ7J9H7_9HYME|nr:uncharacterized protein LOC108629725 isoform X2 [Ceratina calcarata]